MTVPGSLALNLTAIPSFGWMRSDMTFGSIVSSRASRNIKCGTLWNCTVISETRFASRFPERR